MTDPDDEKPADLQDPALLEEIELYSDLMILAGGSPEPLTPEVIDDALGVGGEVASDSTDDS